MNGSPATAGPVGAGQARPASPKPDPASEESPGAGSFAGLLAGLADTSLAVAGGPDTDPTAPRSPDDSMDTHPSACPNAPDVVTDAASAATPTWMALANALAASGLTTVCPPAAAGHTSHAEGPGRLDHTVPRSRTAPTTGPPAAQTLEPAPDGRQTEATLSSLPPAVSRPSVVNTFGHLEPRSQAFGRTALAKPAFDGQDGTEASSHADPQDPSAANLPSPGASTLRAAHHSAISHATDWNPASFPASEAQSPAGLRAPKSEVAMPETSAHRAIDAGTDGPGPAAIDRPGHLASLLSPSADLYAPVAGDLHQAQLVPHPAAPTFPIGLSTEVRLMLGNGLRKAELQLNPAELGPIRIELRVHSGTADITFSAPATLTRDGITQSLPQLAEMLKDQGLSLGQTSVGSDSHPAGSGDGRNTAASAPTSGPSGAPAPSASNAVRVTTVAPRAPRGMLDTYA